LISSILLVSTLLINGYASVHLLILNCLPFLKRKDLAAAYAVLWFAPEGEITLRVKEMEDTAGSSV
jgi:hypothetical protein